MKLPTNSHVWLGLFAVIGIVGMSIGGIIASLIAPGMSDQAITAFTAMLSSAIGGLIGYGAGKGSDDGS